MRLPEFELERYFARFEFAVPVTICSSDIEGIAMGDLLALAGDDGRAMWEGLTLGYTEAQGHPSLRDEIAALHEGLAAEDILVFSGAEEGIYSLVAGLVDPGDHVVCVWPAYQSLYEVARSEGADVTMVELRHDEGWELDLDRVRSALRPSTRLVVVNSPHNPTGAHLDRDRLAELARLAEHHGATLLSDEVYRDVPDGTRAQLPAAATSPAGL